MIFDKIDLPYRYPYSFNVNQSSIFIIGARDNEKYVPIGLKFNIKNPIFKYKLIEYLPDVFVERYFLSTEPWEKINQNILLYPIGMKIIDKTFYSPNLLFIPGIIEFSKTPNVTTINNLFKNIVYRYLSNYDDELFFHMFMKEKQNEKINNNISSSVLKDHYKNNFDCIMNNILNDWEIAKYHKFKGDYPYENTIDPILNPNFGEKTIHDKITDKCLDGIINPNEIKNEFSTYKPIDTHVSDLDIKDIFHDNKSIEMINLVDFIKSTSISDLIIKYILSTKTLDIKKVVFRYPGINNISHYISKLIELLDKLAISLKTKKDLVIIKTFHEELLIINDNENIIYTDIVLSNLTNNILVSNN